MKAQLEKWQIAVIAIIGLLNLYSLFTGFYYGSAWGILFSAASLGALIMCVRLFKEYNLFNQNQEEQ